MDLAKDCVFINKEKVLESLLDEEIEYPQASFRVVEVSKAVMLDATHHATPKSSTLETGLAGVVPSS